MTTERNVKPGRNGDAPQAKRNGHHPRNRVGPFFDRAGRLIHHGKSILYLIGFIVTRLFKWAGSDVPTGGLPECKSKGLQVVQVGDCTALTLDAKDEARLSRPLKLLTHNKASLQILAESSREEREHYVNSVIDSNPDAAARSEEAAAMERTLVPAIDALDEQHRYLSADNHASFPRLRWEFVSSPAGVAAAAGLFVLVSAILWILHADFALARETVRQSPLFDQPNPADPHGAFLDPSDDFLAAFCLVPVCILTLSLKGLIHPPKSEAQSPRFLKLCVLTSLLAVLSTISFAYVAGGHESLIRDAFLGKHETTIGGFSVGSPTPPAEYIALQLLALGCLSTVLSCFATAWIRPFFDSQRSVDNPKNRRKLADVRRALAISNRTLGVVRQVPRLIEAKRLQLRVYLESAIEQQQLSEAHQLRNRLRKLSAIAFLFISPAFIGCGGSNADITTEPEGAALTQEAEADGSPVEVHLFISSATPTERVKPEIETWLTQELPGGSTLFLYEGETHTHVATIPVFNGPPQSRVRHPKFQQSYRQLEAFFNERTVGESHQVNWPTVPETVAAYSTGRISRTWVLLCGNPLYLNDDDPVFSFTDDLVASHGLIGKLGTPFETEIELPEGTLVAWYASEARWGDSRAQRQEATLFQSCFWQAVSGRLTDVTPDRAKAFAFAEPYALLSPPVRRVEKPEMRKSSVEFVREKPEDEPDPERIEQGFRDTTSTAPGSLGRRIQDAGGNLRDLRGESLVIHFYVDTSGSMGDEISETVNTILRLAEELPPLVKSLEIGCTAASSGRRLTFPVAVIRPAAIDDRRSIAQLESFLRGISVSGGDYPTTTAITESLEALDSAGAGKRKFLLLLTDVVSAKGGDPKEFGRTVDRVRRWGASTSSDNRVIALFTGADPHGFIRSVVDSHKGGVMAADPEVITQQVLSAALPGIDPRLLKTSETAL